MFDLLLAVKLPAFIDLAMAVCVGLVSTTWRIMHAHPRWTDVLVFGMALVIALYALRII